MRDFTKLVNAHKTRIVTECWRAYKSALKSPHMRFIVYVDDTTGMPWTLEDISGGSLGSVADHDILLATYDGQRERIDDPSWLYRDGSLKVKSFMAYHKTDILDDIRQKIDNMIQEYNYLV